MEAALGKTDYAEFLLSIKGIGVVTLAACLGDPTRFESPRQMSRMAGYNLIEDSSGKNKSGTKISKRGRKNLRSVTRLTLQNEPKAVQTWDSCVYTAKGEKEFLKEYVWPALKEHHLEEIEIYLWDHNKERVLEWAETIIDDETSDMIAGMAFHWYSGDHFEELQMVKERFPDKKLLLSEACIEYSKFSADDYLKNAQKYAHDMIGNLNQGMNTFIDWDLILDEQGGPNHVKNYCDAPYLYDTHSSELKETNIFAYLWHFTHFIERGAVRIGMSRYTDRLEVCAFQKEDRITAVLLNRTGEDLTAYLRIGEECAAVEVPAESISTGIIERK